MCCEAAEANVYTNEWAIAAFHFVRCTRYYILKFKCDLLSQIPYDCTESWINGFFGVRERCPTSFKWSGWTHTHKRTRANALIDTKKPFLRHFKNFHIHFIPFTVCSLNMYVCAASDSTRAHLSIFVIPFELIWKCVSVCDRSLCRVDKVTS